MSDRPRLRVDVDGGLVRLRGDYHPELVKQIRSLPGRRFIRERSEWVLPAGAARRSPTSPRWSTGWERTPGFQGALDSG
jgi:hypothetical protein